MYGLEARRGQSEVPPEGNLDVIKVIQGQEPVQAAPTELEKAQITSVGTVYLVCLAGYN
jgi:hypothetical protein